MSPVPQDGSPTQRTTWIAAGLVGGIVLAVARARIRVMVERDLRGLGGELLEWRIADGFLLDLIAATLLALVATAVLSLASKRRSTLSTGLAVILAGGLAYAAVVGFPWSAERARLDIAAASRVGHHAALIAIALGAAGMLLVLTQRSLGLRALLALTLTVIAAPSVYGLIAVGGTPTMERRVVRSELLFEDALWTVVTSHPEAPPEVALLTPAVDYRTDSADLPSLIMSPPCEVTFEITPEDGAVVLDIAAGVDQNIGNELRRRDAIEVGFEVTRNGEPVFNTFIKSWRAQPSKNKHWRRPEEMLEFAPGDVLGLRTWVMGQEPQETVELEPLLAGFGGMTLETHAREKRRRATKKTPNILYVVQDTLRSDRLSCYGYDKPTTPHLDRIASQGVRYSQAYSTCSWTWPSTASLLTGLAPDAHGVTNDDSCFLSGRNETLAESLQGRGYTTAAFTSNPLIVPQKNFDQGFEFFDCHQQGFRKTDSMLDDLLKFVDRNASTRFFLYLHLVDPHAPHRPREADLARLGGEMPEDFPGDTALHDYNRILLRGGGHTETGERKPAPIPQTHLQWLNDVYDATAASGDFYMGALYDRLVAHGIEDETIIVFTSDHGEEWLDHGLLTHGQHVHRELTQVPLILAGPGIPEGVVSDTPIANRHIAPTLSQFGGARMEAVYDAVNLAQPTAAGQPVFYSTQHGWWNGVQRQPIYGVRDGKWVLHLAPQGDDWGIAKKKRRPGGQHRLYDVSVDPNEQNDIAAKFPVKAEELKLKILERLERHVSMQPNVQLDAGAATLQMLYGIGYLGHGENEDDE